MSLRIPQCRTFTGYSPCEPGKKCLECHDERPIGTKILIINLDAMGDVIMTTAQLPALKRKYPLSHISWITLPNAYPLLLHNPLIDKIYRWDDESRLILEAMHFDVALNADKNQNSGAFIHRLHAASKLGFGINQHGAVVPLNEGAYYNYRLGLDDHMKFFENQRTGQDILAETFELDYQRDEYILNLSPAEKVFCEKYRNEYHLSNSDFVVGFNTGCSAKWPQKKLKIDQHIGLIQRIGAELPGTKVLLLGGKEDTERNERIAAGVGVDTVISTPTTQGLRSGLCFINLADLVVTGDTFGMHAAIALKKHVIAWFGMSCHQEIDLYDRGVKIISRVECAPCWNAKCGYFRCIDELDMDEFFAHIKFYYDKL
ncbi:MAG: glycosyltransferase family 9 protein [Candidatus Zhuqueibacterota bacterium]